MAPYLKLAPHFGPPCIMYEQFTHTTIPHPPAKLRPPAKIKYVMLSRGAAYRTPPTPCSQEAHYLRPNNVRTYEIVIALSKLYFLITLCDPGVVPTVHLLQHGQQDC